MNKNFSLGISKPLNILDRDIRNLLYFTIEKNFLIHTSITYPINYLIIKYLLREKDRLKINFICKILGDSLKNFENTISLTKLKYGIKKIHILQLVNLPLKNADKRNFDSLDIYEFKKIISAINKLKEKKIVDKFYLQVFSNDSFEFCNKIKDYVDGFAFYANINEIHLKEKVYNLIREDNIPCMLLSIFGNPKEDKSLNHDLHLDSFEFSQTNFTNNTIAVGRTLKISRLKEISEFKISEKKKFNPKHVETSEIQDTAKNFYERYNVTTFTYVIIFIIKCLIKRILGNVIINFLKKKLKK